MVSSASINTEKQKLLIWSPRVEGEEKFYTFNIQCPASGMGNW
jgi:hypothetical protein